MNAVQPIVFEGPHNFSSDFEPWSWYAVQTLPRHEKKVDAELRLKGVESFLPLVSVKRQRSDRQQLIDLPLFPGYVFVQLAGGPGVRVSVLRTSGVIGFVGARGAETPIPDTEIAAVQCVVGNKLPFRSLQVPEAGQRVRVIGGSLSGVEGAVIAVKGEQSLIISVELLQRSLSISIEGYCVEPA
jgi:transcription termination/antitermination protein NusG